MAKTKRTIGELKEVLAYNDKESYLLMPNEAIQAIAKTDKLKGKDNSEHIAVAYTYLYLNTWLYRYAKYGSMALEMTTVKELKNIIGVSPTGTSFDYIWKKNGVLDELGLTKTKSFTEAPIQWSTVEDDKEFIDFTLLSDMDKFLQNLITDGKSVKRRQIKYPTLALDERVPTEDFECNGTFFDGKEYTHQISFDAFLKCMTTDDLGSIAFYLYSFIRSRYGKNKEVQISIETLVNDSGLAPTTVTKYLKLLRQYRLVGADIEDFVVGRDKYGKGMKTDANTYWVNDRGFNSNKQEVAVRKVVSIFHADIEFSVEALAEKSKIWNKTKVKAN